MIKLPPPLFFFFPPPNNLLKKPKNKGFASPSCGIERRRITATDNVKVLIVISIEKTFNDSLIVSIRSVLLSIKIKYFVNTILQKSSLNVTYYLVNVFFNIIVNLPGVQRGWNCKRFCCLTNSYKQFDLFKFARADQTSTVANNNTSQACLDRCRIWHSNDVFAWIAIICAIHYCQI